MQYAIIGRCHRTKLVIKPPQLEPNAEIGLSCQFRPQFFNQSQERPPATFICTEETKVRLDENQSVNLHFLAETPLFNLQPLPIYSQNKSVQDPIFHIKN
jgi:hypothetical protein